MATVLVVCRYVLLHIVRPSELLLAAGVGALDALVSRVHPGRAGGVGCGGDRPLAAVTIAAPARVALAGALLAHRWHRHGQVAVAVKCRGPAAADGGGGF